MLQHAATGTEQFIARQGRRRHSGSRRSAATPAELGRWRSSGEALSALRIQTEQPVRHQKHS